MWRMDEDLIVKAMRDKRGEIHGPITAYEAQIEQAKHDLAHVNATLRLFTDVEKQRARYVVSHGFFRKGEIADLCALQLRDGSELTTRALAERVMQARDLDATDATLRNSVVFKVVQALRHAARRKLVVTSRDRTSITPPERMRPLTSIARWLPITTYAEARR